MIRFFSRRNVRKPTPKKEADSPPVLSNLKSQGKSVKTWKDLKKASKEVDLEKYLDPHSVKEVLSELLASTATEDFLNSDEVNTVLRHVFKKEDMIEHIESIAKRLGVKLENNLVPYKEMVKLMLKERMGNTKLVFEELQKLGFNVQSVTYIKKETLIDFLGETDLLPSHLNATEVKLLVEEVMNEKHNLNLDLVAFYLLTGEHVVKEYLSTVVHSVANKVHNIFDKLKEALDEEDVDE